jgi:hypothetical protein
MYQTGPYVASPVIEDMPVWTLNSLNVTVPELATGCDAAIEQLPPSQRETVAVNGA